MKLDEYKKLNEDEQFDVLWSQGILIDACLEGSTKKLLYAIDSFYVELWLNTATNKVLWRLSFKQGKLLEKYLEKYTSQFSRIFQ